MGGGRLSPRGGGVGRLPVVVWTRSAAAAVSTPAPVTTQHGGKLPRVGRQPGRPLGVRWRLALVVLVAVAVIGLVAAAGLGNTLVYYRTPTGLLRDRALIGQQVRVGGLVEPGSLHTGVGVVRFTLTDGVTFLPVLFTGPLVGTFQAGQDALVGGRLGSNGVFHGTSLMVKHSNVYRAPDGTPYHPPKIGLAGRG